MMFRCSTDALLCKRTMIDPRGVAVFLEGFILNVGPPFACRNQLFSNDVRGLSPTVLPASTSCRVVRVVASEHLVKRAINSVRYSIGEQHVCMRIACSADRATRSMDRILVGFVADYIVDKLMQNFFLLFKRQLTRQSKFELSTCGAISAFVLVCVSPK
ncbi:hypothetical protein GQ56_0119835 [Burkholderia paludis]|nr:hypothetical protein GQ56_0119835 [Burkholderia paludis]